jgi:hypothetical protein
MNATLALPDEEFVAAFEASAPPEGFPHRAHVRLAWLYVCRLGPAEAAERVVDGIRRLAHAEGADDKFDERLTRAWVARIAAAAERSPVEDFGAFLELNPQLLDSKLLGLPAGR